VKMLFIATLLLGATVVEGKRRTRYPTSYPTSYPTTRYPTSGTKYPTTPYPTTGYPTSFPTTSYPTEKNEAGGEYEYEDAVRGGYSDEELYIERCTTNDPLYQSVCTSSPAYIQIGLKFGKKMRVWCGFGTKWSSIENECQPNDVCSGAFLTSNANTGKCEIDLAALAKGSNENNEPFRVNGDKLEVNTGAPTMKPTKPPVDTPPTKAPVDSPTKGPTKPPTRSPTRAPTKSPTRAPTRSPTGYPTTAFPTNFPTTPYPTSYPTPTDGCTGYDKRTCKSRTYRGACKWRGNRYGCQKK